MHPYTPNGINWPVTEQSLINGLSVLYCCISRKQCCDCIKSWLRSLSCFSRRKRHTIFHFSSIRLKDSDSTNLIVLFVKLKKKIQFRPFVTPIGKPCRENMWYTCWKWKREITVFYLKQKTFNSDNNALPQTPNQKSTVCLFETFGKLVKTGAVMWTSQWRFYPWMVSVFLNTFCMVWPHL